VFRLISPVGAPTISFRSVDPAVELIADSGTEALDAEPKSEAPDPDPRFADVAPPERLKSEAEWPMFGVDGGGAIAIRGCEPDPAPGFAVRSKDAPVE